MLKPRYSKSSRTRSELMRLRKVEKCLMISVAVALPIVALSQYLGPTEQAVYTSVTDVELTDAP